MSEKEAPTERFDGYCGNILYICNSRIKEARY